MGPSGGGKTSLLNALAGQVPETKGETTACHTAYWHSCLSRQRRIYPIPAWWLTLGTCYAGMHLQGNIRVNGQPRGIAAYKQGYVQQEDMFYAQLTVRWERLDGISAQEHKLYALHREGCPDSQTLLQLRALPSK